MKLTISDLEGSNNLEVWDNLVDNHLPDFDETNLLKLDSVSKTFCLLVQLHYQIMNGGIIQFIDNSTGDFFHETIEAAKNIGFTELEKLLLNAAEKFPNGKIPSNWEVRRQVWDEIGDAYITKEDDELIVDEAWESFWEDLDNEYYSIVETLYLKTIEYLKNKTTMN